MKIIKISTWPPWRDGIALYSSKLCRHLSRWVEITVLVNLFSNEYQKIRSVRVTPCWSRDRFHTSMGLITKVIQADARLVHLQFGWKLYGGPLSLVSISLLLMMSRLMKKKVIVTMHTVLIREKLKQIVSPYVPSFLLFLIPLFSISIIFFTKLVGILSTAIIVHNKLMKRELTNAYGIKPSKIYAIPHGVDNIMEDSNEEQPSVLKILLFLGFLRPHKGLDDLIQAYSIILKGGARNIRLNIVGGLHTHDDPSYFNKILQNLERYEMRSKVVFHGFVDEEKLDSILRRCSFVVLPYLDEGFIESSGVVAKVMSYGKPIICTRIPKFQGELQHGVNCVMVPPRNPTELAKAILMLIKDNHSRKELSIRLKEEGRERRWYAVARQHFELYKELVRGVSPPHRCSL